jgi:short-subunit dehydrogenase
MKSAIITGASKGIGKAISLHFAKRGYSLLLIARTTSLLKSLQEEIKLINPDLHVQVKCCDVADTKSIREVIKEFHAKVRSISLLINNAGYVKRGTSDLKEDELEQMLNTNLIGAVNMVREVVPIMKEQSCGYIINMSSRNAKTPRAFLGGYAAAKAALLAYSESLYKELGGTNIKVTAICPGFVDTEMTSEVNEDRNLLIPTQDIGVAIDFLLNLSSSCVIKELCFESVVQIGKYC